MWTAYDMVYGTNLINDILVDAALSLRLFIVTRPPLQGVLSSRQDSWENKELILVSEHVLEPDPRAQHQTA